MGLMVGILSMLALVSLLSYPLVRRFERRGFVLGIIALGGSFAAFATQIPSVLAGTVATETIDWIPQLQVSVGFRLDALSLAFALLVTGAGALVYLYSLWYFDRGEPGTPRFSAVFLGFATSMLGLVVADDVYLLFIFWEATTIFSFLLIGHQSAKNTARSAAIQALIVTTLGGLAMLVGLVLLSVQSGTSSLHEILSNPPATSPLIVVSIYLILVGGLSKSAIFPFHFWLPAAMAAPTPVSAYLHAAAMVKAGIYLFARIVPTFSDVPGIRTTLVVLGGITMIIGGLKALRQFDLKLLVAHGTVSQLGMLAMVFGLGLPATNFAGFALLFAHAIAKAPLFLVVGIIDHRMGTRDYRKISGLGRQHPWLGWIAAFAALSMAGAPVFVGFVAKESALIELFALRNSSPEALLSLIILIVGSVLTAAYMARFLWGGFATKRSLAMTDPVQQQSPGILVAPLLFVIAALLGGIFASFLDPWARSLVPAGEPSPTYLSLWHGVTPELIISISIVLAGGLVGFLLARKKDTLPHLPERFTASHLYWSSTYWLDHAAVRLTSTTQRGSLPFYLATILVMVLATLGITLSMQGAWPHEFVWSSSPVQLPIAIIMALAAIRATQSLTRFKAVVLVGVTGYGMSAIFALHGAPDLALTQALVETVALIAFILVIRRLPIKIGGKSSKKNKLGRALLGIGVGLGLGMATLIAFGARSHSSVSTVFSELALEGGHGRNIVNVILVDIRGWDTMGELSVVLAAATGVASLVFLSTRGDNLPKLSRKDAKTRVRKHLLRVADPNDETRRVNWMLAGQNLDPERRSIILEVVVRVVFHALIVLSIYLLLTGHNSPGGGFSAGLVAGIALVARYLAGGRHELGATVTLDAGRILGIGLALATLTALVPLFFGQSALASSWFDLDLGPFGEISFVTSTIFDIGVYLVVFGLILDVLRSLGAEIDEHEEEEINMTKAGVQQ